MTKIEWADDSWNPVKARRRVVGPTGENVKYGHACVRVSPGCTRCYAATMNRRLGTGLDYTVPAMEQVEMYLDEKVLLEPLRWRKPRRVFVCSMTDLFGEWVPDEWLDRIFAVMALTPAHTFQVLTKRAVRMEAYGSPGQVRDVRVVDAAAAMGYALPLPHMFHWPLPNVWAGVSIEDQPAANNRIPHLLRTVAAVRWVSAEPLLGPVDFTRVRCPADDWAETCNALSGTWQNIAGDDWPTKDGARIDWLVTGGESGPGARTLDLAWARSLRDQCAVAGIPLFVKQDSGPRPGMQGRIEDDLWRVKEFPR